RVIERCFAAEEFSHKGKYYDFPDVRITTTPVQRPGPPIWVASMGEQSVAWTARRGYHLAAGAGRGHARYEELLVQFGHDRSKRQVASIPVRVHLAETRKKAWDEAEAGLRQVLHFYRSRVDLQSATSAAGVLDDLPPVGEFRNLPGTGHRGSPFVVGTPDEVGRALALYRDKRLTHLSLNFHQPGTDTNAVRRSMEIFAKELMPAIKAW
ncbi:MAG TPA: LLM class flavin-dependent oxidoreductase, partial [Stellaceae bacterium]|nr:LLM class flavin-dependent oxidoreductase [Stellaceae bacterium]